MEEINYQAFKAVDRSLELMDSAGYSKEWYIEEHWRDIRTIRSIIGGIFPSYLEIYKGDFDET